MAEQSRFRIGRVLARKTIRELLGISIWLHALYVTKFLPLPALPSYAEPRYVVNTFLAVFIINYSFFSDRGWWSVLFDLGYLYFLPFIYAGRVVWLGAKSLHGSLKNEAGFSGFELLPSPTPSTAVPKPVSPTSKPAMEAISKNDKKRIGFLKRLLKFALLWSIFVFTVNYRPVLGAVVVIVFVGALGAFQILWRLFSTDISARKKIEYGLQVALMAAVEKIVKWNGVDNREDIRVQVNTVRLYSALFNFIHSNRSLITRWSFAISLIVSVPFYLYMSYLFGCCYFGLGKLTSLHLPFSTAFLDSLYMPFAWTELPKEFSIRLIGGLQGILISAVGYSIFFRHLGTRFEGIQTTVGKLKARIDEGSIRQRIIQVESQLSQSAEPKPTQNPG